MENKENNNSENISSLKKEEEENKMETENVENIEEHEPLTTKVFFFEKNIIFVCLGCVFKQILTSIYL